MLGFGGEYPAVHPTANFWHILVKNRKKLAVKVSIGKSVSLNFVYLSPTLCPILPEEKDFHFYW